MVARLSANDHKKLLEEALVSNMTFKSLGGTMPCQVMVDGFCFNIYVKSLSSAHLRGCDDVWRAQLPQHKDFKEMKEAPIPFVFLGYDSENDVYATWSPHIVKQRLNEAKYVSFYSRLSGQREAHDAGCFVRRKLNNDGEVLIFPRSMLNSYLVNFSAYFPNNTEYVAMGSKRRKEANDAYRLFNDAKNLPAFAKYLEQKGCHDINGYCKMVKMFINRNIFSCHRKIFLACNSIREYEGAVCHFLEEEDVQAAVYVTDVKAEDVLHAYVLFLANPEPAKEPCPLKNGKVLKITDQELLRKIEPYLNREYQQPIPAMLIAREYYEAKFQGLSMELKDWMSLVTRIDWGDAYNAFSEKA